LKPPDWLYQSGGFLLEVIEMRVKCDDPQCPHLMFRGRGHGFIADRRGPIVVTREDRSSIEDILDIPTCHKNPNMKTGLQCETAFYIYCEEFKR